MKRTMIASALLAATLSGITGCGNGKKSGAVVPAINPANMDVSVKPGNDFYSYVNGGWIKNNPLKPEYSRYGVFDKLANDNLDHIRTIVAEAAQMDQSQGTLSQKITTFYNLGMDSVRLNGQGAAPIAEDLAQIDAVADGKQLAAMIATLHKEGVFPYFVTYINADEKNSSMNVANLYQAGLGMGDRDYYTEQNEDMDAIREAYKAYVAKLFALVGYSAEQASEAVSAVLKIEGKVAEASYPRELLRDTEKNYNKINGEQWVAENGMLDWNIYFDVLGLNPADDIVVKQTGFFNDLASLLADVTLDEQKSYLKYNLIASAASFLSDDFINAVFDFHGRTMTGQEEMKPRWKRVLSTTDGALSEAIGKLYVERYFPASSKEKMIELVGNLKVALGQRIDALDWMSDATKAKAREKLAAFRVKIGYPDKWRNYDGLDVKDDSYWANVRRANIFDMEYMLSKVGKPVDRDEWLMSPQTVNAYYNPTTNEICFPAAILQPPFFNPDADDAVNYGGIGVVIGHEMTHGFDDQGRNYDKDGNISDWWTAEDAERFTQRADVLVKQFDAIEVAPGVHANGAFTLGENIADQGGLLVSRQAYENSLPGGERPSPIDGFTDVQRFYIAYATLWAQNIRPEEVLRLTKIDPHSLGVNRVNATLRNIADFYTAFDISEGDSLYMAPENRVNIW